MKYNIGDKFIFRGAYSEYLGEIGDIIKITGINETSKIYYTTITKNVYTNESKNIKWFLIEDFLNRFFKPIKNKNKVKKL